MIYFIYGSIIYIEISKFTPGFIYIKKQIQIIFNCFVILFWSIFFLYINKINLELLSKNNNQKKTFKWNNFSRMFDKTKRGNYNHFNNSTIEIPNFIFADINIMLCFNSSKYIIYYTLKTFITFLFYKEL